MDHIPQPQIRPTEYMLAKTTILIVDDEAGPRESLKMILSPAHKVILATSGKEALEVLRTTPVDLVTIDLNMPAMKGDELMKTIREDHPSTEIIVITGYGSMQTAVEGLRSGICDYIAKPFDVVEVSGAVSRALDRKHSRANLVDFLESVGTVLGKDRASGSLLEDLATDPELRARLQRAVGAGENPGAAARPSGWSRSEKAASGSGQTSTRPDSTLEFLDVLAEALESRDGQLRKHAQRVGFYADLLADRLGIEEELREQIRISSFLHDIGKVGLSDEDRARAQIDGPGHTTADPAGPDEHAEIGSHLVQPLGFDDSVAEAIRCHHEHWDGGGRPEGLRGDAIPLAARVIAVVDHFDKLTGDGPEGEGLSAEAALAEIRKRSGTQFDPALVMTFVAVVENGDFELDANEGESR
jgi:putative two-component system response regulator